MALLSMSKLLWKPYAKTTVKTIQRLDENYRKWALHFYPVKDCICMKQKRVNVKLESVLNHCLVEPSVAVAV